MNRLYTQPEISRMRPRLERAGEIATELKQRMFAELLQNQTAELKPLPELDTIRSRVEMESYLKACANVESCLTNVSEMQHRLAVIGSVVGIHPYARTLKLA